PLPPAKPSGVAATLQMAVRTGAARHRRTPPPHDPSARASRFVFRAHARADDAPDARRIPGRAPASPANADSRSCETPLQIGVAPGVAQRENLLLAPAT